MGQQHDDFATETVFIELERCLTVTVEHEIELSQVPLEVGSDS